MAASQRSRIPSRVIVETAPDPILEDAVVTEQLYPLLGKGRSTTPKLGVECMAQDLVLEDQMAQDLCLAPEGQCACAQGQQPSQCLRVRVPWWVLSTMLPPYYHLVAGHWGPTGAPLLRGMQLRAYEPAAKEPERNSSGSSTATSCTAMVSARSRTPSPDNSYSAVSGCRTPPPRLVLAPAVIMPQAVAQTVGEADRAAGAAAPGLVGLDLAEALAEPEAQQRGRRGRVSKIQTATHLRRLDDHDPEQVIMVRKITRLGFNSPEILRRHFERYGPVDDVLLSGAAEKPQDTPLGVRVRPSGFGFVLMRFAKDAAAALAHGAEQAIEGTVITVQKFERRANAKAGAEQ